MWDIILKLLSPVQLIGYVGMACAIGSYQCKKNRNFFIMQLFCAAAFTIQLALLHSYAGMMINVVSILRGIVFSLGDRCKKPRYLVLLITSFVVSAGIAVFIFNELWWMALILLVGQGLGTLSMWTRNGKTIRYVQLGVVSPAWIINNVYYGSAGGVACEIFNILSVLVSFVRFRKSGYDKT